MFAFFTRIFSGMSFYLIVAAVIAVAIGSIYFVIRHDATKLQKLQDEVVILNQAVVEQKTANEQLRQLIELNNNAINNLNSEKEQIKQSVDDLNNYLSSKSAMDQDRPSSEILKKTVDELRKRQ